MSDLFTPGQVAITANASQTLSMARVSDCLKRHLRGDWGDCCAHDRASNNRALKEGTRLFSVYPVEAEDTKEAKNKFWIITEADRSSTTILMPEDY